MNLSLCSVQSHFVHHKLHEFNRKKIVRIRESNYRDSLSGRDHEAGTASLKVQWFVDGTQ